MTKWICIIDIGQYISQIGWGGENEPRHNFFTICGTPKYTQMAGTDGGKEIYVGNEVIDSIGLYKIQFPIQDGIIADWDLYKEIIKYVFYLLRVDPSQVHLLYAINPFISNPEIKDIFKLFLEEFQVRGFYPVQSSLLTMYSGGFDTGLVIDMGAESIRLTPIYQSFEIKHAIDKINLAGNQIDKFMLSRANSLGINVTTSAKKQLMRTLKEIACFVSLNYEEDLKHKGAFKKSFSLPDGSTIEIGEERFMVPELIFKPHLNNVECPSLPEKIIEVIETCDVDTRPALLSNIFLTGGTSLFPNIARRLKEELERLLIKEGKTTTNVRIIAPNQRQFSNWVGGSILSQIPEFQSNWVTRKQYFKSGIPPDLLFDE